MATIGFYDSSSIKSLFSGLNSGNTTNTFDLTTYNSIRNGSYGKLMKQYYNNTSVNKNEKFDTTDSSVSEKTNATKNRDNAADLIDAQKALKDGRVWEQKDKTVKAVTDFVDKYNSLVSSTGDASNKQVLTSASTMVGYTKANSALLKSVGISVGSDNKLSVDKDVLNNADATTLKSVFTGSNSYGQTVAAKAASIYSSSVSQLSELSSKNMYTGSGSYQYISGANYNWYT